jgi:hypothetical protein
LLAADWQIRPLLPSDILERQTDLIRMAFALVATRVVEDFNARGGGLAASNAQG